MTVRNAVDRSTVGRFFAPVFALVAAALAACGGGGGGSSLLPHAAASSPASGVGGAATARVQITVAWPQGSAVSSSSKRVRNYVSNSTASVSVIVNGGTPVYANNPNLTPGTANSGTQATTVLDVNAPVGNDTFLVGDYDAASGGGNLLAQNSIPFTVVAATDNTIGVTLNGNLGKVACAPIAPFVTGSAGAYTVVGPTGQVALLPEDLDGNVIITPGALPQLALTAPAASATVSATKTTNEFNVNVLTSGATVTLSGTGDNLANTAVSGTCTITRVPALYVTNYSEVGGSPSVTIYPASASGDATPTATLAGAATLQSGLQFPAVDPAGNLFLTNLGPVPGATYGPSAGYVTEYGPGAGQNGNVAPVATIAGFNRPEGIQFDSSGNLYVLSLDRIQEFPPTADGITAPAAASSSIVGPNTQITTCYGLAVTTATIYATCVPYPFYIAYWPVGTVGNVAPTQMEYTGSVTTMGVTASYSEVSWLGIAVDPTSGTMYTPDANNNINEVYSFPAGSSGMTPSTALAKGFTQPIGIFEDANGKFYVANYGANSISIFTSATTLALGTTAASATISGLDTGLNYPYGVTVR